jgi:hypothetical protein
MYDVSSGAQVFQVDGQHFNHKSGASIRFADGRLFVFPVAGDAPTASTMTAVDESGNGVIMFRKTSANSDGPLMRAFSPMPHIEVAVHPDWHIVDDLLLMIVAASRLLDSYFTTGGACRS